jgi:hypothetical protein
MLTALEAGRDAKQEIADFKAVMDAERLDDIMQAHDQEPDYKGILSKVVQTVADMDASLPAAFVKAVRDLTKPCKFKVALTTNSNRHSNGNGTPKPLRIAPIPQKPPEWLLLEPGKKYTACPHPQGGSGVYEVGGSTVCSQKHPSQDKAWDAIEAVNPIASPALGDGGVGAFTEGTAKEQVLLGRFVPLSVSAQAARFSVPRTLGSKVKSIMARGLEPRGDGAASDDLTSPSVRDYVYLGTGKCAANHICRVMECNLVPKKGIEDSVVILRVGTSFLKKRLLRPDEDWCTSLWDAEPPDYAVGSGTWAFNGRIYPDEEEATLAATGELVEWARRCWYDSLVEEESVAYKGIIPFEVIAVVAIDESDHGYVVFVACTEASMWR